MPEVIDIAFGALFLFICAICVVSVWLVLKSWPLPYFFTFILYMFLIGPLSYRFVAWLRAKAIRAGRKP